MTAMASLGGGLFCLGKRTSWVVAPTRDRVYPNVPSGLLTGCGIGICVINLSIYAVRFQRYDSLVGRSAWEGGCMLPHSYHMDHHDWWTR